MKKQIKFIIILFVAVAVVSGCSFKKQNEKKPETLNNQVPNQATSTITVDEWKDAETIYSPENYDYTGWKTYINEDLGYEVKYPADWIINSCDEGCFSKEVSFNPPNAEDFVSYVSISLDNRSISQIESIFLDLDYKFRGIDPSYNPYTEEKAIFNEYKVYYFIRNINSSEDIIISNNGLNYRVMTQKNDNSLVKQVISSFKFIK